MYRTTTIKSPITFAVVVLIKATKAVSEILNSRIVGIHSGHQLGSVIFVALAQTVINDRNSQTMIRTKRRRPYFFRSRMLFLSWVNSSSSRSFSPSDLSPRR